MKTQIIRISYLGTKSGTYIEMTNNIESRDFLEEKSYEVEYFYTYTLYKFRGLNEQDSIKVMQIINELNSEKKNKRVVTQFDTFIIILK